MSGLPWWSGCGRTTTAARVRPGRRRRPWWTERRAPLPGRTRAPPRPASRGSRAAAWWGPPPRATRGAAASRGRACAPTRGARARTGASRSGQPASGTCAVDARKCSAPTTRPSRPTGHWAAAASTASASAQGATSSSRRQSGAWRMRGCGWQCAPHIGLFACMGTCSLQTDTVPSVAWHLTLPQGRAVGQVRKVQRRGRSWREEVGVYGRVHAGRLQWTPTCLFCCERLVTPKPSCAQAVARRQPDGYGCEPVRACGRGAPAAAGRSAPGPRGTEPPTQGVCGEVGRTCQGAWPLVATCARAMIHDRCSPCQRSFCRTPCPVFVERTTDHM